MKSDKRGFTVIELILSFAFVMFLAIGMFALLSNYRNRSEIESTKRDLLSFKNTLTSDIYQDTIDRKVKKISYCTDEEGNRLQQCIKIYFLDSTDKTLEVVNEKISVTDDGTTFDVDSFYILYGGVKYDNPSPKFTKIVSDYILTYTTDEDHLEYGVLYKINIRMKHQDIDEEFVVSVVTTGTS